MAYPTTQSITPAPGRAGFFEVLYRSGKPGIPDDRRWVFCMHATGYVDAQKAFERLELGQFIHIREVSERHFHAWIETPAFLRVPDWVAI
jgi:hypothetical protein